MLWLNPNNADTFPDGLLDALDDPELAASVQRTRAGDSIEGRLRKQMHTDALRPLSSALEDAEGKEDTTTLAKTPYNEEELQEAMQFLRLGVSVVGVVIISSLSL